MESPRRACDYRGGKERQNERLRNLIDTHVVLNIQCDMI